jgi:hypothetical protein
MRKKKAVSIGINDYKDVTDLRGCENDSIQMHALLVESYGFKNADIRVLTSSRATKEAIEARLCWLVQGAEPGDCLVFHFAGHGSQVRDRNGDELTDQLDEILCPYDMDWDGRYISDDDLNRIFGQLPRGVALEVFLDCCHSGTGLRRLEAPREGGAVTNVRSRYLEPPVDIALRALGEEPRLKRRGLFSLLAAAVSCEPILWTGCRDNQTSADADIDGVPHGAFTYHFAKTLRAAPGLPREKLAERVRLSLNQGGFNQIPQLEATASARAGVTLSSLG